LVSNDDNLLDGRDIAFHAEHVPEAGATIMGDGRVSLIMDISAVVRYADRQCREAAAGVWADAEQRWPGSSVRTTNGSALLLKV
jgi:hypothetical protein